MKKRASLALIALLATLLPTVVTSTASASSDRPDAEATYTVELRNITSGQYLTPPNFAAHGDNLELFERGDEASPGIQALAENGAVPVLAAELAAAVATAGGVSGVGSPGAMGPLSPGETSTFEFTTSAEYLSVAAMLVCTNDGFAGLDARRLPGRDGQSHTYRLDAYDAGTEINTELRADLVPAPFCGPGAGSTASNPDLAENGVISRHRTLRGVGDLADSLDWSGPVAKVTITRNAG
jgi:hypothetical protein